MGNTFNKNNSVILRKVFHLHNLVTSCIIYALLILVCGFVIILGQKCSLECGKH